MKKRQKRRYWKADFPFSLWFWMILRTSPEILQEAYDDGIREGRKEGKVIELRNSILKILETKFGISNTFEIIQRLETIDEVNLLRELLIKVAILEQFDDFNDLFR